MLLCPSHSWISSRLTPCEKSKEAQLCLSHETCFWIYIAVFLSVFDKGIITRHLKNGANLHQTTPDRRYWGKLKAAVFARYGRSPLGGRPVLVIKAAPSRPRPFNPKSINIGAVTSRQNRAVDKPLAKKICIYENICTDESLRWYIMMTKRENQQIEMHLITIEDLGIVEK